MTIPFDPAAAVAVLCRTPGALRALLAGLPDRWLHASEGADTFSAWEVVAHLLATWAVHDLGHIRQVARVMAKQYADEVGPWRAYLPVLSE